MKNTFQKHKNFLLFYFIIAIFLSFSVVSQNSLEFDINNENSAENLWLNDQEIIINTPENKTYTKPMSGYYPGTFGFENDVIGSDPSDWIVDEAGGTINVIALEDGHNNVLEMDDTSATLSTRVDQDFTEQATGTIEFWAKFSDTSTAYAYTMRINDEGTAHGIYMTVANGKLSRHLSPTTIEVCDLNSDQWYHLRIEFDTSTDWHLWVDSVSQDGGSGYGYWETPVALDGINFNTPSIAGNKAIFLDAFGYSWDSSYTIGDNRHEGLLLSYENSTILDWVGYSLSGAINKTILGNTTIPMPSPGHHTIQVVGNNSIGEMFESDIRHFSINALDIITPENKTYTKPMSGYYPGTFGFENDVIGSDPSDWIVDEAGGTINVIALEDGHNNVLEMDDTSATLSTRVDQDFTEQATGTIEFWAKFSDTSTAYAYTMRINDEGTAHGIYMTVANGKLSRHLSPTTIEVCDLNSDQWYHLRIEFDTSTDWHLWVDSVSQDGGSGYGYWETPVALDGINFNTPSIAGNKAIFLDAFGYSWDSSYTIGDNRHEGLLLSYENSTNLDWVGYSLNGAINKTIVGNTTIILPEDGAYNIQVFGNNTMGTMYESNRSFFFIDTVAPSIIVNSPSTDDYINSTAPNFDVTIIEVNLDNTWYTIDDGVTNITFSGSTGKINQTEWDKKGDGPMNIRFYADDIANRVNFTEVVVNKDTAPPSTMLMFTAHQGPDIVNESTTFTLTSDDGSGSGVSIIRYKINDSSWVTYTAPFTLANYAYGDILISYQAVDLLNNYETTQTLVVHRTDTIAPTTLISFTPYTNTDIVIKSTTFSITATDDQFGSGISIVRYKINNTIWFDYIGPFDLSSYDYGEYTISYQAIDIIGNIETEHGINVVLVPEPSDPGIAGYQLFIMISIIGMVTVLFIRKKLKNIN